MSDKLLSDEELTNTLFATFFRLSGGMNNIATAEAGYLLDLINNQKRLYALRIIGEDEITYANYEDGFFGGKRVTRDKLRAEQRAKLTNTKED